MLIPFLVFAEHFCTAVTGLLFPPRQPMLVWYLLCAEWGPLNTIRLGLEGAYNLLGSQTENEYETVMCGSITRVRFVPEDLLEEVASEGDWWPRGLGRMAKAR